MIKQSLSGGRPSLPAPVLPQAVDGVLNLGVLADAVLVSVKPYVNDRNAYPERDLGDQITVTWTSSSTGDEVVRRYSYLANPVKDASDVEYEIRVRPLWALPAGGYDVSYTITSRTGNTSRSESAVVTVSDTPAVPSVIAGGVIQTNLFGVYLPGLVGTWIAPGAYAVKSANDVLVKSLASLSADGKSTPGATLKLYKNSDSAAFASVVSNPDGTTWVPNIFSSTNFVRGDLISIQLDGSQDATIFLALAV